ncbi:hypothetical protein NPIL_620771 [Nephila pilipes]|uniref:Uncharacterized protein n=1 Tax=Nephila pilipes TaxID=299642 RepID=A0A8X6NTU2_NEPPI|nr:hypothetical protein NPIL_620771 [Nephila pilipes]
MPLTTSSNPKRVRIIISSLDKDELPQQILIRKKKAKLNYYMWFNNQPGTYILLPKKDILKGNNKYKWLRKQCHHPHLSKEDIVYEQRKETEKYTVRYNKRTNFICKKHCNIIDNNCKK